MQDFQYYPTPLDLAKRAWGRFKCLKGRDAYCGP